MQRRWITVPATELVRGRCGVRVHTAQWQGREDGHVFVAVHGLGGSHTNWSLLAPLLTGAGTVFAPDLAGFGLTPPTGRTASVRDNVDLLAGFVRTISRDRPVVLLGNSMGGLISIVLAATRPGLISRVVLVAPASPRPLGAPVDPETLRNFSVMALPVLGERFLARRQRRLTPQQQVQQTMALCVTDPSVLPADMIAEHVEMVRRRRELAYAHGAFLEAARSLLLLIGPRSRLLWGYVDDITAPTLLVHGRRDRLVTSAAMAALAKRRPDWTHVTYDDLGHIPMLERPKQVAEDILEWMTVTAVSQEASG